MEAIVIVDCKTCGRVLKRVVADPTDKTIKATRQALEAELALHRCVAKEST